MNNEFTELLTNNPPASSDQNDAAAKDDCKPRSADAVRVEQSLKKRFRTSLVSPFLRALKKYELIQPGDRIAVCTSGGKDSMLMAKLFQEILHYSEVDFSAEYLVMDPGYNRSNRVMIEENAKKLEVPIRIFETDIFNSVHHIEKSPCYLCARMRRGHLYHHAKELGCNKIALGHHYDDVIETVLMGMLYGAQYKGMMPKLHSMNFPGMELIRPLYLIREDDIISWKEYNNLKFLHCACRFTEASEHVEGLSKRRATKALIRELKKDNPDVEKCIFSSMENVNIDTVLAYKKDGVKRSFLEDYDKKR